LSAKRVLLIVRKPPGVTPDAWEALRFALSLYAADAPVTVALEGLGVFNCVLGIPEPTSAYSTQRFIHDLESYGVSSYVVREDLMTYLASDAVQSTHARPISRKELAMLVADHDVTIAF